MDGVDRGTCGASRLFGSLVGSGTPTAQTGSARREMNSHEARPHREEEEPTRVLVAHDPLARSSGPRRCSSQEPGCLRDHQFEQRPCTRNGASLMVSLEMSG